VDVIVGSGRPRSASEYKPREEWNNIIVRSIILLLTIPTLYSYLCPHTTHHRRSVDTANAIVVFLSLSDTPIGGAPLPMQSQVATPHVAAQHPNKRFLWNLSRYSETLSFLTAIILSYLSCPSVLFQRYARGDFSTVH